MVDFDEFISQLRRGNVELIEDFVRTYESFIRRLMRPRIKRANLAAALDSVDICQSVFGSFLFHLTAGDYEIASERQLQNLLYTIARRKFSALLRREYADRRDRNRTLNVASWYFRLTPSRDDPQQNAEHRDVIEQIYNRLTVDDRELFRQRQEGLTWDEIAGRVGGSATVLRKRYSRAVNLIAIELGVEEPDD